MRVGFVVAGGVDRGGVRRVVPELLDLLTELSGRHEIHVVSLRQEPRPGAWQLAGADVWNVGARPRRLRALLHLIREHRRSPFDVLLGYGLVPQGALVSVVGGLLGVPSVVAAPGGDFVDLEDIGFGGWRNTRGRFWVRLACRGAAACVVPSASSVELAKRRGFLSRRIPLPLARQAWPLTEPEGRPGIARVAWIGSLNRVKNPELLLGTAAYLRGRGMSFAVDVVGEDFRGGAVERRVREEGLEPWVTFHGHLVQEEVRAVLRRASLLLVTSRFEGASRVVLEAASVGVPTVGTKVGYVAAWSPHAAVAVEDPTPRALGDAILMLSNDEELRMALGRCAQARLSDHEAPSVAAQWDSLLTEVVSGGMRG